MKSERSRRGRPPQFEINELRERAMVPMLRLGYQNVTMSQIAAEVNSSVRTLHRYFPNKADIVWGSIDRSFFALRDNLAQADGNIPIAEAIAQTLVKMFVTTSEDLTLTRNGLRLVALNPELQAAQSASFSQWRKELTLFVARRLGISTDDLLAVALGTSVQTAIMAALGWWAVSDDRGQPEIAVAAAVRGLSALGEPGHLHGLEPRGG